MRFAILALPVVLATATPAFAGDVYSQTGTQACSPSCWTSHYASGAGFRTYDDFTLSNAASITSVSWQGIYIPQTNTSTAPAPDTLTWNIGFYADNANFPGAALASTMLPAASVTATYLGTGTFGSAAVSIYSFTAALSTAFQASAGVKYWFSPLSQGSSFDPFFSWSAATATYDNLTAQTDTSGNAYMRANDRIFSLATSVPEPATWAMMIAGFGLAGGAMRRRSTTVAFAA